jgi:hypothetical protein
MPEAWEMFESYVEFVYQSLLDLGNDNVVVARDVRLTGRTGIPHQIDVYYQFEKAGFVHRVAIECRNKSRAIDKDQVMAFYAVIVFLIGFILGTVRVLLLAPRLGETIAVTIEAPMILTASWFVCRWCVNRLDVAATVPARSLMGLVAFLVLMSAEVGLGAVLGRSLVDQVAAYGSQAGAIGLAAQVIFAMFPVVQVWGARPRSEKDAALF